MLQTVRVDRKSHESYVCRLHIEHRIMCWKYYVIIRSWRDTMFVKNLLLVCVWQPDKVWLKCMIVLKWEELHLHDRRWWELLFLVGTGADRTFS